MMILRLILCVLLLSSPAYAAVGDKTPLVSDAVYGADWDGVTKTAPSKNAVYDKLKTLGTASTKDVGTTAGTVAAGDDGRLTTVATISTKGLMSAEDKAKLNDVVYGNNYPGGESYPFPTTEYTSASSALQAAIDYAQDNKKRLVLPRKLNLRLDTPVTIKHGRSATDTMGYTLDLDLNGCTIYPNLDDAAIKVVPRCLLADAGTGRGVATISIYNGKIDSYFATLNSKDAGGILWGAYGYACDANKLSAIHDILGLGPLPQFGIHIIASRMIDLARVIMHNGKGLWVESDQANHFAGDLTLTNCQFGGTTTNKPLLITAAAGGQTRGIHMTNNVIYGSGASFTSDGAGTMVADIWLSTTAWDGPQSAVGEKAVSFAATNGGDINNISINGAPYFGGYSGTLIDVVADSSSIINKVQILNPKVWGNIGTNTINFTNVTNSRIDGGIYDATETTDLISINGANSDTIHIQGNIGKAFTGTNLVNLGTGVQNCIVDGTNVGGTILNNSGNSTNTIGSDNQVAGEVPVTTTAFNGLLPNNTNSNTVQKALDLLDDVLLSGSGTVSTGVAAALSYYPAANTTVNPASGAGTDGLFWDNTNKRLGVGDITPESKIKIEYSSTGYVDAFIMENLLNPAAGADRFYLHNAEAGIKLTVYGSGAPGVLANAAHINALDKDGGVDTKLVLGTNSSTGIMFYTNDGYMDLDPALYIQQQFVASVNRVGINTGSPTAMLHVNAAGSDIGMKIEASGTSDALRILDEAGTGTLLSVAYNGALTAPSATITGNLTDGTNTATMAGVVLKEETFTLLTPQDVDDPLIKKFKRAGTLKGLDCIALGTTPSITVAIHECDANGANCADSGLGATCTGTNANDVTITDAAIDSGDWLKMVIGAPSGTVNQLAVTLQWTE